MPLNHTPPACPPHALRSCDEALGCFLLQQTQRFAGAEVVRTRDPELLKTLDVVVDVGGEYDPGKDISCCSLSWSGWQDVVVHVGGMDAPVARAERLGCVLQLVLISQGAAAM